MKRPYYLFSNGRLKRRHNTLTLVKHTDERVPDDAEADEGLPSGEPTGDKVTTFPIEAVDSLFLFGEMDINTKLITFLAQQQVPVFCFDYYGNFTSVIMPRAGQLSGSLHVKQAQHYLTPRKRMVLARALVEAAIFNIMRVIKYYVTRVDDNQPLNEALTMMDRTREQLEACPDIPTLMSSEGRVRDAYYQVWSTMLGPAITEKFPFNKRERRPPSNELNALISFGNSMCYSAVLRQLYRTALDPTIAYLHEPGDRRFSLALDVAEIFKPLLVDRAIFRLLKTGGITPKHFEARLGGCYLTEAGRKVFIQHWDERMKQTVNHRGLGRKVSYERLVRLECHKLVRHFCDPKEDAYQGLHMWW